MKRPAVFAALLLLSLILVLSAFGVPLTKTVCEGTPLAEQETRRGTLRGRLSRADPSAGGWRFILEEAVFTEAAEESAEEGPSESRNEISLSWQAGKVLVYADSEPDAPLGSILSVRGRLSLFPAPDNPGEFDRKAYYMAENILLRLSADEVRIETRQNRYPIREAARRTRAWLGRGLSAAFSEEDAGVMKALILGDRSVLSDR